ncbi:nucleoid-associated protein [Enterococcus hirae]|uniref:nucleoid-associated protein n=1 Tax=Enterococcus hirae TaxID=1354 RepID=UPI0015F293B9|nr:nucleoid-associated protein [Enterococcus hirae]MBA5276195.1 nucleoid-associated protein [Enterococcus hirae]
MNIEISKIIVHKLNLGGAMPIYSNKCIDLNSVDNIDDALEYFKTHIINSRKQSFMKRCQFEDLPDNTVLNDVKELVKVMEHTGEFENLFIEKSKKMTKKLFSNMKSTSSKSDGSLFVIYYSIDGDNYIGILKLDPNTGIEINDDLTIKVRKSMLPSINEKLHKLAFILIKNEYFENDLHLYVLDRQKGNNETAKYFMEQFLNARELSNNSILTKEVEKEIINGYQKVVPRNNWPKFRYTIQKNFLSGKEINLEEDLPNWVRPFLEENDKDMDLTAQTQMISGNILSKYPDATMKFVPEVDFKKPTIYQSKDKEIEIRISKDIDNQLIMITEEDPETGDFILRVKRALDIRNTKL